MKPDFFDRLQTITEAALSYRKRRKRIKREKQAQKNVVVDWIEAFIWAASVVLLINQYLFQAYQIPSGSMIDTLLIRDRIFVNKLIYGPELLPGWGKLNSPVKPARNDIIIFESPSYISRGTAFDIAQRIIYMLTLSFVDIDKDQWGNPKAHFLIKRAIGMGGDRIFNKQGEMFFQFAGEDRMVAERDYNAQRGWTHTIRRMISEDAYPALTAAAQIDVWTRMGLKPPAYLTERGPPAALKYIDAISYEAAWYAALRSAYPNEDRFIRQYYRKTQGWFVPKGRILPLGDNRDNSLDGRFFGAVRETKVLGQGVFIYWPGIDTDGDQQNPRPLAPPPQKTGVGRIGIIR